MIATFVALLVFHLGFSSYAQSRAPLEGPRYSHEADRTFVRALTAHRNAEYEEAERLLQAIVQLPKNQRSTAALLMLSRTQFRLGDFRGALDAARTLERAFPDSRYAADGRLMAGDSYYAAKRYYEAATQYAKLLRETGPLDLQASAAERLAAIIANRAMTSGALDRIRDQLGNQRMADATLFGEARWYERLGWHEQSRQRLLAYTEGQPKGMFAEVALRKLTKGSQLPPDAPVLSLTKDVEDEMENWEPSRNAEVSIGVLLPLTGRQREFGQQLLSGVRLAVAESDVDVDLVVADTGHDYADFEGEALPIQVSEGSRMVHAVAQARRLIEHEGVRAIIGPLFSTTAAVAAAVAEAAGVPLITPLADQSGLDRLGSHVFQLNVVPEIQGRSLAEYATLVLGLETLALLSPLSDYGWAFEQAFTATAIENGGTIVHSDWYFPGETTDFQSQFEALRQVGFQLMDDGEVDSMAGLDSLALAMVDTTLDGEWTFIEVMEGFEVVEDEPDSAEITLDSIDGIVLVVEHFDDASTIAPQLRFHRFQTQMLGNDIWFDPEAIRQMIPTEREHMKGCIFVSRRQGSEIEQDFVDRYRTQTGRDPGFAAYGYDAARLLITAWEEGNRTTHELRDWLASLRDYEGVGGRIGFESGRRVNAELALLQIDRRGSIRPLESDELPILENLLDTDLSAGSDLWNDGNLQDWDLGEPTRSASDSLPVEIYEDGLD
ncbi:MAG: ABC transporter substrate-binding protein [Candidatus Latescibacterota bacterium]|nr:ABC transporter substrate-binding protein [Candidatus Latescibacterota bacterium]